MSHTKIKIMKPHSFRGNTFLDESFICLGFAVFPPQISIIKQMEKLMENFFEKVDKYCNEVYKKHVYLPASCWQGCGMRCYFISLECECY